jgi:hemerythrin superfamily protein
MDTISSNGHKWTQAADYSGLVRTKVDKMETNRRINRQKWYISCHKMEETNKMDSIR